MAISSSTFVEFTDCSSRFRQLLRNLAMHWPMVMKTALDARFRRGTPKESSMPSAHSVRKLVAGACLAAIASCGTTPPPTPRVQYMEANGARLPYVDEGRGPTVLFVHGGLGDYRTWNRQRNALAAEGFRAISYSLRYFGTGPWAPNWPAFGVQTHADDLAAFIRGLDSGPVHLVGWSYGGSIVLAVATKHSDLLKSALVYEPGQTSHVTDPLELKTLGDDAAATFGPVMLALKSDDNPAAAKQLIDALGGRKGYFEEQPPFTRAVQLDSARVMPALFADKAPPISCTQLGQIKPPVAIGRGASGRPFFRVIADSAARCMPNSTLIVVPNAGHLWPGEDVPGFNATLVGFLKGK
ncbi:alpha/beta hydrolase [Variovorax sp. J22R133]|uniref:alpha/beta fold hydrolase n=1 Tax=Variovorax brevis TaxID=3053503 RepID=UPI002577FC90|nr:alpha/beta hydrolase [Variovorax sp. J22R133]MDM0114376.1 alpha/beta hydrolase [Variovorax sp. J22R133]